MRKILSSQRGVTFVEATLVIPIVLALLFFVISLGFAISQNALFTDSVRAAGRAAVSTLGDCDSKQNVARNVLKSRLESQGLSFHDIAIESSSMADDSGDVGFNKRGFEVKVKGKLAGLFNVQYSSFSAFEGDDDCS